MDLREKLKTCKKNLKPTTTVVTDESGDRYEIVDGKTRKLEVKRLPYVVDTKPDMQVARMVEGLFLSSQDPTTCVKSLRLHRINHVLSLGVEPSIKFDDIRYDFVEFLDLPEFDLAKILKRCFVIIERGRRNNILVHCNAGVSRSATVIIGYLMAREGLEYDEAYETVKAIRNCVKPNDGFARQLRSFSNLKDVLSESCANERFD